MIETVFYFFLIFVELEAHQYSRNKTIFGRKSGHCFCQTSLIEMLCF